MSNSCRVLLIEDSPSDARLFAETLSESNGTPFDVTVAERLDEGLLALRRDGTYDVVVLDMTLPDSSGMSTFEKTNKLAGDLPIVILSGMADEGFAIEAVKAGAEDYLVKGRGDAFWLARSLRYAIERRRERLRRQHVEHELHVRQEQFRIARNIQQHLFPHEDPKLPGFDISGASFPADETGGDYFDYLPMTDGYFSVVIGDVSGHGVGPALLMAETHACLRTLTQIYTDPQYILGQLNNLLVADMDGYRLVTLFLMRLHLQTRSMEYASAGHRGYWLDADGRLTPLNAQSIPLAIEIDMEFPVSDPQPMQPGDVLLLATDGSFSELNQRGDMYGEERLIDVARANRHLPADEIVQVLHDDVRAFSARQDDEMTFVVVKTVEE